MLRPFLLVTVLVAAVSAAHAQQQEAARAASPPDPRNGEVLSQRWCASCHLVSRDQRSGASDAPTFASIAKVPQLSAELIALFLLSPHPRMPDMALTRKEAADIAVYIRSLAN